MSWKVDHRILAEATLAHPQASSPPSTILRLLPRPSLQTGWGRPWPEAILGWRCSKLTTPGGRCWNKPVAVRLG